MNTPAARPRDRRETERQTQMGSSIGGAAGSSRPRRIWSIGRRLPGVGHVLFAYISDISAMGILFARARRNHQGALNPRFSLRRAVPRWIRRRGDLINPPRNDDDEAASPEWHSVCRLGDAQREQRRWCERLPIFPTKT